MALRMYPVSASRWAQLAGTRVPDNSASPATYRPSRGTSDRWPRVRAEHAQIQAYLEALTPEREPATR